VTSFTFEGNRVELNLCHLYQRIIRREEGGGRGGKCGAGAERLRDRVSGRDREAADREKKRRGGEGGREREREREKQSDRLRERNRFLSLSTWWRIYGVNSLLRFGCHLVYAKPGTTNGENRIVSERFDKDVR
jgi:hypothetical protein